MPPWAAAQSTRLRPAYGSLIQNGAVSKFQADGCTKSARSPSVCCSTRARVTSRLSEDSRGPSTANLNTRGVCVRRWRASQTSTSPVPSGSIRMKSVRSGTALPAFSGEAAAAKPAIGSACAGTPRR